MAQVARHLCNFVDWRVTCHWDSSGGESSERGRVRSARAAAERSSVDNAVDYAGDCDEDSDRSSDGDNAGPVTASQAGRVHAMGRCRWPLFAAAH